MSGGREAWASLSDRELLAQCDCDTYRASGPGGQKRNKTSSAIRLRHPPSGIIVIAEESRSQHENRARALRRLRQAIYLRIREAVRPDPLGQANGDFGLRRADSRLDLGPKHPEYWRAVGLALDALFAAEAKVSSAAATLGITTANLVDFLRSSTKVWQETNQMRVRFGQRPLHDS